MARRRTVGLLGLVAVAGAAWLLFGRRAGAAEAAAAAARADLLSRGTSLTLENVELLKSSGVVPADAREVIEDPQHIGPAIAIGPGVYVVGPLAGAGAPAGAAGYGSLLYPTDVYATPLVAGGGPSITPGLWY